MAWSSTDTKSQKEKATLVPVSLIGTLLAQMATKENTVPESVEGQLLVVWLCIFFVYVNKCKYMLISMEYLAGPRKPHLAAAKEVIPKECKLG